MGTEYLVSSCNDCPLTKLNFGLTYFCGHPYFDDSEKFLMIEEDKNEDLITPEECPLKSYPLMLKTKEWQLFETFWEREN